MNFFRSPLHPLTVARTISAHDLLNMSRFRRAEQERRRQGFTADSAQRMAAAVNN
jgi:hypothetical protein